MSICSKSLCTGLRRALGQMLAGCASSRLCLPTVILMLPASFQHNPMRLPVEQGGCSNKEYNLSAPFGGCQLINQELSHPGTGRPAVFVNASGFTGGE
jgi:hypothetical protein